MNTRLRARSAGFTLIEVVIAIMIAAVVVLALGATLKIAFDARDTLNAVVDQSQSQLVVARTLRQDLETALRPTGGLASNFVGESDYLAGRAADSLEFETLAGSQELYLTAASTTGSSQQMVTYGADTPGSRTQRVRYELVQPTDDASAAPYLVRSVQRHLLAEAEPAADTQVLVRDVQQLDFRYYDGTDWLNDWDSAVQGNAVPTAVEVICSFGEDRTSHVIEVIRLPLAASVSIDAGSDEGSSGNGGNSGGGAGGGGR